MSELLRRTEKESREGVIQQNGNPCLGLAGTIEALKKEGYCVDYNLRENSEGKENRNVEEFGDEFDIDTVYRFDEMSDPADQSVLYAIRSRKTGAKGILLNSFGAYTESSTNKLVRSISEHETHEGGYSGA